MVIKKYERLAEFMLGAEKWCRGTKTGYIWSLKLVKITRTVRYWKNHNSGIMTSREPLEVLVQFGKDVNIIWDKIHIDKMASNQVCICNYLIQAQQNAAVLQDEHLKKMSRCK
eukprot:10384193-Ditylum_brightwellii.AAC.1